MKTLVISSDDQIWMAEARRSLGALCRDLTTVDSIAKARTSLAVGRFRLILLNTFGLYNMETCDDLLPRDVQALRKASGSRGAKVIVLYDAVADSGGLVVECLRKGADGFVCNDPGPDLPSRVRSALDPLNVPPEMRQTGKNRNVFVAMPFDERLRYCMDYYDGIASALEFLKLTDVGLFRSARIGELLDRMWRGINSCAVGIANISLVPQDLACPQCGEESSHWVKPNGNVLFEAGVLKGQDKHFILLFCTRPAAGLGATQGLDSDLESFLRIEYAGRADLTWQLIRCCRALGF